MAIDLTYPHVEKEAGKPARLRRVPRIRVAQIAMDHLAHGWSAEEILRQHPYLLSAEAYSTLAFYYDHQEEIDKEMREELEQAEEESRREGRSSLYLR